MKKSQSMGRQNLQLFTTFETIQNADNPIFQKFHQIVKDSQSMDRQKLKLFKALKQFKILNYQDELGRVNNIQTIYI